MNLFQEMKLLMRENYSNISKHFDGEFKNRSIEGFVKLRERIMKRKINNIVERKHPIERTLDIMCKNKKIKILNSKNKLIDYDEEEKRAKQHFNIDNEISDIFKEENIHSKLKDKKNSVKTIIIKPLKIVKAPNKSYTDRTYSPNYNSIRPHSPACSFLPIHKSKSKITEQKLLERKLCSKYKKHDLYYSLSNQSKKESNKSVNSELNYISRNNISLSKETSNYKLHTKNTSLASYASSISSSRITIQQTPNNKKRIVLLKPIVKHKKGTYSMNI